MTLVRVKIDIEGESGLEQLLRSSSISPGLHSHQADAMPKHVIWGFEVPLPASDIYTALLAVGLFLPTVVLAHNIVAFVVRRIRGGPTRSSTSVGSKPHQQ